MMMTHLPPDAPQTASLSRRIAIWREAAVSVAFAAGLLCALMALPDAAHAQARLEATYVAKLAGIPVGKGAWTVSLNGDHFVTAASGGTSGWLRAFSTGSGTSAARGRLSGEQIIPSTYAATLEINKKSDDIRMELNNTGVKTFSINPEPPEDPARIPITEESKRGVKDPMSAILLRVRGTGHPLSEDACRAASSVFDGRLRYDVVLEYRRMDQVKAEKGYQGPSVVCGVRFTPVAGHNPERKAVKYIASQNQIEVWLVPIGATRFLVPFRVTSPTPVGMASIEARDFVVYPQPIPASIKTP
jgi:hypothetical protein